MADMAGKILLAFDFDHTVIDENSDLYIKKLAPNGIPQEIEEIYSDQGWTEYMGAIFAHLHENGIDEEAMLNCIREIPLTKGMKELLQYGTTQGHENIVISDSNSTFISSILQNFELSDTVSAVYTNPAEFDPDGKLNIEYYHTQDWCHLSTVNLCKGHILEEHLKMRKKDGVQYSCVIYIGDGTNDLCPSLRLEDQDYVCARINYSLWKKIKKIREGGATSDDALVMKARVRDWETGFDILKLLQQVESNSAEK